MVTRRRDAILGNIDEDLFDMNECGYLCLHGIRPLIRTPRDAVRYTNFVAITYPAVKGDVNIVDFLGLEALRVFEPEVFEVVRGNQGQFEGFHPGLGGPSEAEFKAFHLAWFA